MDDLLLFDPEDDITAKEVASLVMIWIAYCAGSGPDGNKPPRMSMSANLLLGNPELRRHFRKDDNA